jgi:hypothetical protein
MTVSPLERVLTLSMRILKASLNPRISLEQKGLLVQKLNARQADALAAMTGLTSTAANDARTALVQYLGKLSEKRIREQL